MNRSRTDVHSEPGFAPHLRNPNFLDPRCFMAGAEFSTNPGRFSLLVPGCKPEMSIWKTRRNNELENPEPLEDLISGAKYIKQLSY